MHAGDKKDPPTPKILKVLIY